MPPAIPQHLAEAKKRWSMGMMPAVVQAREGMHVNNDPNSVRSGSSYRTVTDPSGRHIHDYGGGEKVVVPGAPASYEVAGGDPGTNPEQAAAQYHNEELNKRKHAEVAAMEKLAAAQMGVSSNVKHGNGPHIGTALTLRSQDTPEGIAGQAYDPRRMGLLSHGGDATRTGSGTGAHNGAIPGADATTLPGNAGAIKRFQEFHHLPVTGKLDERTRQRMQRVNTTAG